MKGSEMLKLLVSTKTTQGRRPNDFSHVPEGEIVAPGSECDTGTVDDQCGCKRRFYAIECRKPTTTFQVALVPLTRDELARKLSASRVHGRLCQATEDCRESG